MAHPSPITHPNASIIPWGSARVVAHHDAPAVEYAAMRKSAGVMDRPERGVAEVTGSDRLLFLDRMLTQKLAGVEPGTSVDSFWLNRKGRIDADLRVFVLPDRVLLEYDGESRDRVVGGLGGFIIGEDASIRDVSHERHRIDAHGPRAGAVLASALGEAAIAGLSVGRLWHGDRAIVSRDDATGSPGFELIVERDSAASAWQSLLAAGALPVGWHAFNTARIEAGRPMYNIDFGPESLPGETGLIDRRVHFAKGCYLGQEIVARMANLGHPKQYLVALLGDGTPAPEGEARSTQPITGGAIRREPDAEPIGAITSSSISPMLGGVAIAFAAIKHPRPEPGSAVWVECDDDRVPMRVQPGLAFWPTPTSGTAR